MFWTAGDSVRKAGLSKRPTLVYKVDIIVLDACLAE